MLIQADARYIPLKNDSVQCVVTSPPYWGLRDYGTSDQLGLEPTPEEYAQNMVEVFREVKRVLKPDGTLWLNLGDSYAGSVALTTNAKSLKGKQGTSLGTIGTITPRDWTGLKPKDLVGIPWRVAFALQADGWWLRSDIIWSKPNPMPESITDRPTKAHEYIFLLSKSQTYYYDHEAIREKGTFSEGHRRRAFTSPRATAMGRAPSGNEVDGWVTETGFRNKRSVWRVATQCYSGAHFATFPEKLIEPCLLAGSPEGGIVLDPFVGSGTTIRVARKFNRVGIGLDLAYQDLAKKRITEVQRFFPGATGA